MIKYSISNRLYLPSHFIVCVRDMLGLKYPVLKNSEHIREAINWLTYAQDVTKDGGVSAGYFFRYGWRASYPETTGYIIPTMFDYYHFIKNDEYRKGALKMSDWLINIQLKDGAFQGRTLDDPPNPMVFDTGQCLHGLIRAYNETKDEKCRTAAIKAGDWLVSTQDEDGAWRKFDCNNLIHTFHTQVAWSLLELFQINGDNKYKRAAIKNIEWALRNQKSNGWFKNCAIDARQDPSTHTIAYTVSGILESGVLLNDQLYIEASTKTANMLLKRFEIDGYLASSYNEKWESGYKDCCLVGCAQISIIWLRLFEITHNERYLNAATKVNNYLKTTQNTNTRYRSIRGAIKGSHPIWGRYSPYSFPNWAVKFFIDALLLEEKCKGRKDNSSKGE